MVVHTLNMGQRAEQATSPFGRATTSSAGSTKPIISHVSKVIVCFAPSNLHDHEQHVHESVLYCVSAYVHLRIVSVFLTLKQDKDHSANHRNEVQRQVYDIANQRLQAEPTERALQDSPKPLDRVAARLELSALFNNTRGILLDQSSVKGVQDGVLQQEIL